MRYLIFFSLLTLVFPPRLFSQAQSDSIEWLLAQQNDNGGWSDTLSERSSPGMTAEVIIALWAAGVDVTSLEPSPLTYLENYANSNANELPRSLIAQFALVAALTDSDVEDFGGINLRERLFEPPLDDLNFLLWGNSIYEHCLVMLGAFAIQQELPQVTVGTVQLTASPQGWGIAANELPDSVTTALCLQALLAWEIPDENIGNVMQAGWAFLRQSQQRDGGWAYQPASDFTVATDAYSTAAVIIALNAAGEDLATWNNPQAALLSFQQADGSFRYNDLTSPEFNIFATTQAIIALSGKSYLDIVTPP